MPQRMKGYTEFRGTPWPPEGAVPRLAPEPATTAELAAPADEGAMPVVSAVAPAAPDTAAPVVSEVAPVETAPAAAAVAAPAAPATFVPGTRMAGYTEFRGQPWPPAGAPASGAAVASPAPAGLPADLFAAPSVVTASGSTAAPAGPSAAGAASGETPEPASAPSAPSAPFVAGQRMAGYTEFRGAAWPPAPVSASSGAPAEMSADDSAPVAATVASPATPVVGSTPSGPSTEPVPAAPVAATAAPQDAPPVAPSTALAADQDAAPVADRTRDAPPAAAVEPPKATPAGKPAARDAQPNAQQGEDAPAPSLRRRLAVAVGGVVVLGLLAVLGARWLITLGPVADFVARYPGVPAMPEATPTGVPAWLAWQHFLNLFLMTLIIRTGLQIRGETRPPANFTPNPGGFFAPKGTAAKKFSLTIWTHQALDVLWALNGLVFVVLLAVTGHWMRLIPLDPATPQHMASTALQYATLDWPAHDGWLHYNALQMVSYSFIVFIAAPVAMLTGFRMSSWWPAKNERLTRAFPMELARKLHFPTMVVFAGFIVVHVALVLFSGVLTNLNAMFLARQAADGWGLVALLVGLAVTAAAWVLLKPAFLSPVAEKFGRVGR